MGAKIETQITLIHSFGSESPNNMIVHYRSHFDFEGTTCSHVRILNPKEGSTHPYISVSPDVEETSDDRAGLIKFNNEFARCVESRVKDY